MNLFLRLSAIFIFISAVNSFNTLQAQPRTTFYVLSFVPKSGGKMYHLYRNSKVLATFKDNKVVGGKVRGISKDSISIDYINYPLSGIVEFKYHPGSTLGAVAGITAVAGLITIAVIASGGKDKEFSDTEKAILYSGIGVAVVGVALLIPGYFIKKKISRADYDFVTTQGGG